MAQDSFKATQFAMLAAFAIRQWLDRNERVELTSLDIAELLETIDGIPVGHGVIADLTAVRTIASGSGTRQLAWLLTFKDDPSEPFGTFANHHEVAESDDLTTAMGIYSREEAIAYGLDIMQNREAMRLRLADPDGPDYGRGILRRVLMDLQSIADYWNGKNR